MKTIAVIFGGRSTEHDISIVTALSSVIKPLELTGKYKVEAIYIAKDGSWYWGDELKDIILYSSGRIDGYIERTKPAAVRFDGGMELVGAGKFGKPKTAKVDIVFPSMHGTFGEDGALMGLLDMANVPYIGCGLDASSLAMDKATAKQVAAASGIDVSDYVVVKKNEFTADNETIIGTIEKKLKYPLFIKPAHLGSSIGISRAADRAQLQNAIEVAAHYDDKVLVEEEVQNLIEVTLPIIGNDKLKAAFLERPLTSAEDFFDFETKYMQGGKKGGKKGGPKGAQGYSELPAKLDDSLYKKAENTALDVYRALGCSGIARVDMLIDSKTEKVYFNEVNPLPGGLYAHNWRAAGISSVELVESLVGYALERHENRRNLATAFSTNYLKQF